ncbi:XdhC protein (assists in molybdopterin insertion into xanthine dehydrogenase) [Roseibacterium elongatum DSM 19469]|uniref:XdhC protein (Assists in molybdopterin insertion into xanthine dehydrogenase) n=1 Tax=Roseicyclus elongatus DSM 19469 TaxID=1294273 RepID=W8RP66_9RHOB|nr:xanthine dehydrogenase accessory protein XdhC [Roseibacterium elongatum]AHM02818.1 XdhC protein (assists in molybdopterin insertion into xanthine dehydrogenase) [Roseibacterium elongatum DSM 19469]
MSGIRVTVTGTRGSAPREVGAAMLVFADRTLGTIGGGALEWQAMDIARRMIADGEARAERTIALGPALGQCCGGVVTLRFETAEGIDPPPGVPLWVWGAGHVGRAIVATLAPLPHVAITWIDTATDRFPAEIPHDVTRLIAAEPPRAMAHAPVQAHHLILTYSHEIDLALCHAALTHGFARCGLIGSGTKWARFRTRLGALGHADAEISRIDCPIGDPSLGKHPQAIAVGVAARLLKGQMHKDSAERPDGGHQGT